MTFLEYVCRLVSLRICFWRLEGRFLVMFWLKRKRLSPGRRKQSLLELEVKRYLWRSACASGALLLLVLAWRLGLL